MHAYPLPARGRASTLGARAAPRPRRERRFLTRYHAHHVASSSLGVSRSLRPKGTPQGHRALPKPGRSPGVEVQHSSTAIFKTDSEDRSRLTSVLDVVRTAPEPDE